MSDWHNRTLMAPPSTPRVFAFCSGRTGTGQSTTVVNLALAASEQGISCLLWDANLATPSLHTLLGLDPLATAADSYLGNARIEDIPVCFRPGIWLVPERPVGNAAEARLSAAFPTLLQTLCRRLQPDVVFIDAAPGWSESVTTICATADLWCLLTADDIGSILDAYGLLKALTAYSQGKQPQAGFVVTHVVEESDAQSIVLKLNTAARRFLGWTLPLLGSIPYEPRHRDALLQQRGFLELYPHTPTAQAYRQLLRRLLNTVTCHAPATLRS